MGISWIKLSTTMFDDDKIKLIDAMPDRDALLIIWVKLLAQAGKCNASGYLVLSETIPLNEELLASLFNRPLNTIRLALDTFERLGMVQRQDGISITNWLKHQNVVSMDKVRELTRARVQKHRKKICNAESNVTETRSNGSRSKNEEKEKPLCAQNHFDDFWSHYPRRVKRPAAEKAWAKLKPDKALLETILSALDWQRQMPDWQKDGGKFIPHASTWLNNRQWEDERPAVVAPVAPSTARSEGTTIADLREKGLLL